MAAQIAQIAESQKAQLLRMARETAVEALGESSRLAPGRAHGQSAAATVALNPAPLAPRHGESETQRLRDPRGEGSIAGRFGGLFVTFWNKEKLRGCVGAVTSTDDVCDMIQHVTRSSLIDPRFRDDPIEATELPRLTIEVSLISEPVRTKDPAGLICGVHGVIVRRGDRSGCFLPKVAVERCWSAEQFLSNCCTMKAGLPPGAWRQPETEVLLFTADSFREPENA